MEKLLDALARLIEALRVPLVAFLAYMGGRSDERAKLTLRDLQEAAEMRDRVSNVPSSSGLPMEDVDAYFQRKGRLRD